MLCYRNVLAGALADGGSTGQTSVHLYTADRYKRYFLAIGDVGGISKGEGYNGVRP